MRTPEREHPERGLVGAIQYGWLASNTNTAGNWHPATPKNTQGVEQIQVLPTFVLENLYQTAGPKKPRELIIKSLRDRKKGRYMAVRHVMSDGTRRDSIEGYIVPKDSPVYGVIRKAYEEGVISADEATKEIDKRSKRVTGNSRRESERMAV